MSEPFGICIVNIDHDCLREIEETAYWPDLLAEANLVGPERLQPICHECGELIAIFVTILKRSKGNPS